MTSRRTRAGKSKLAALLAALGFITGCTCIDHLSVPAPIEPDLAEAICCVAECSRCHVYLFFLQGYDPVDCADLESLKETVQAQGFTKAWYGPACYVSHFKKEVACVCEHDPKARFVLVGYKHGVSAAVELAAAVASEGGTVDLLICLGSEIERPERVGRVVSIQAGAKGCEEGAVAGNDVHFVNTWSHKLPMHPKTVEILSRELLTVAAAIPSVSDLPKMYVPRHEPTPRPVMPTVDRGARDEWDFLKPASAERHTALPPGTVPELKQPAPRPDEPPSRNQPGNQVSRND
jgi:hypothetical protein